MKTVFFVVFLLSIYRFATAQDANQFPDQFVKDYVVSCIEQGKEKGKSEKFSNYFCNCSIKTMQQNYSYKEFLELDAKARVKGEDPHKYPKFDRVMKQVEQCRKEASRLSRN